MRLYLSSFRVGDRGGALVDLVGDNRKAAVVANAMDAQPPDERMAGVQREIGALSELGLEPEELDLRGWFEQPQGIDAALAAYGLLWLRGGNVFVLRTALRRSGADEAIIRLLTEDALVYGGYSAGPCVLGPTIGCFAVCDDPGAVRTAYGDDVDPTGLGVLDHVFVPHVDSTGHPETAKLTALAAQLAADGVPHRAVRDGEVVVVR